MLSCGVPQPVAHFAQQPGVSGSGQRHCPWPGLLLQRVPVLCRLVFLWVAGIWALLHPAKRPNWEAGHCSSKNIRRKRGCVQDWRRGKQQNTQKGLWGSWKREQYSFLQTTLHGEWCVCGSEQGFPRSDACVIMAEEPESLLLHIVYLFM